MLEEVATK